MAGQQNSMGGARGRDASLSNAVSQRRKDDEAQFARLLPKLNQTNADTALGYLIGQILNKPFHNWLDNMFMPKSKDKQEGASGTGGNAPQNNGIVSPEDAEKFAMANHYGDIPYYDQNGTEVARLLGGGLDGNNLVVHQKTPNSESSLVFQKGDFPIGSESSASPDAKNLDALGSILSAVQYRPDYKNLPEDVWPWRKDFRGVL